MGTRQSRPKNSKPEGAEDLATTDWKSRSERKEKRSQKRNQMQRILGTSNCLGQIYTEPAPKMKISGGKNKLAPGKTQR
jgi:hypothetical protein